MKLALLFDTLDILGVVAGAYLVIILPSNITAILMGVFLILSAWRLWSGGGGEERTFERRNHKLTFKRRLVDRDGNVYEYGFSFSELASS